MYHCHCHRPPHPCAVLTTNTEHDDTRKLTTSQSALELETQSILCDGTSMILGGRTCISHNIFCMCRYVSSVRARTFFDRCCVRLKTYEPPVHCRRCSCYNAVWYLNAVIVIVFTLPCIRRSHKQVWTTGSFIFQCDHNQYPLTDYPRTETH